MIQPDYNILDNDPNSYLNQIGQLSKWEYCFKRYYDPDNCDDYRFGYEDGFHFYMTDFLEPDDLGQFQLDVYLNKKQFCPAKLRLTFDEIINDIKEILNDSITNTEK
mgnify:CR=1 FL=1